MKLSAQAENSTLRNIKNYIAIGLSVMSAQGLGTTYVMAFLSFVYTEFFDMPAKTVGVVLATGAFVDGVSDFVMGFLIDRVHTKHGKIKHWFLWMAAPLALSTALLFMLPVDSAPVFKVVWLVVMYNLYCTAVTAVRLPANTLPTVISRTDKVRTVGGFVVAVVASVGSILTNSITVPSVNALGGGLSGYRSFGIILSAIMFVCCLLAYFMTHEDSYADDEKTENTHKGTKLTVWQQVKYLVTNKYWVIQLGMTVPFYISAGCSMGCAAYFCEYVVGNMDYFGTMMTILMVAMLAGNVVWLPISRKMDARAIFIIAGILGAGGYVLCAMSMFVFGKDLLLFSIGLCILSFGEGAISILDPMITGRVVDYGDYVHHERQEGLCFSGKSVVQKIVSAICTAVLGFALSKSGYVAGYFPESAVTTVVILISVVPAVGYGVCILCSCLFGLNGKKMTEIRSELEARYGK